VRWGLGRNSVNKTIAAAELVSTMGTFVPKPANEGQARELAGLEPEVAAARCDMIVCTCRSPHSDLPMSSPVSNGLCEDSL
jgi:hypothetical protein